ncbi:BPTI/Kunitz domain-containing protein-like [Nerophis ophidion]|uniref:BPTI/Kunitz domain-containing protein-like n=1 Tax=Nerophis ophidion TaxID=159077 RepID=UPI002ADF313B|nr:BPTI/Kunitz domain-containing protein-like [Nerophis ophidion]
MKHLLVFAIVFAVFYIGHSAIPDFCQLEEDEGVGSGFIIALHYSFTENRCNPFIYKGSEGNANRFLREQDCMRNCSASVDRYYPTDATSICLLTKSGGGCSGRFLRYYYDSVHDKCKKFFWTGCHGNGNRFFDHDSCNATCAGVHDDREEEEEEEPDTPIAIICGVLLAVIIISIFTTVIVLTVQSKKKQKTTAKSKDGQPDAPLRGQSLEMA